MPLITRNTLPPGGFVYTQNDNNGKKLKEFRSMSSFNEFAKEIFDMRVGNKLNRATLDEVKDDIDNAQCERLGFDPNHCAVKKKAFQFQPVRIFKASTSHLRQVAGVVEEAVGRLSHGANVLMDWVGSGGKPVSTELAQQRADTCLGRTSGSPCPHNQAGFKPVQKAAEVIKAQIEKKNELKLSVQGEEKLQTCLACWCHLPLKIWTPIEHVVENTPTSMIEKLRQVKPDCWQISEIAVLKQTPTL